MANKMVDKIKESLNTTPVAFRWLLLGAAFIVVLILLFLLMSKPKATDRAVSPENRDVKLIVNPESADFKDTKIGDKAKQPFKITATYDVIIESVKLEKDVDGFNIAKSCVNKNVKSYPINKSIPCLVDVTYTPGDAGASGDATVVINWHDKRDSRDTNQQTDKIVIPFSAKAAAAPAPAPKPVADEVPAVKPAQTPVVDETPVDEETDFTEDEEEEMPDLVDDGADVFQPVPAQKPAPTPKAVQRKKAPEKCSDFAMPGYSTSGAQIGWIKPKDGRYEFHPFADKDCNKPTGIYNPDTGIITSIDGKGKKIGTDADHVGWTGDITSAPKLKSKNVAARASSSENDPIHGMGDLKGKFQDTEAGMELIAAPVKPAEVYEGSGTGEATFASRPYDRSFILRQFKPIPATIVSEVRADPSVYCPGGDCSQSSGIPVRATVDRNVYSDNGRNIIIPTGTLLMGYLTGELPGPYKSVGRMKINWYQFIRPDGVEFNFDAGSDPYSADSQGRVGVPGYGSTDYIEQMVMPLLTAMIPAAVNMIAPIADTFVNQIDLDNNTVVQSGTVRSSELAKNEVITAWNKVAQKLMVDALDNTTPPFSIAAGTRITVYSPVDLIAACGGPEDEHAGKKCAFHAYSPNTRRPWSGLKGELSINKDDPSWVGQVRSFDLSGFCEPDSKGVMTVRSGAAAEIAAAGHDYRTVLAYCQAQNYQGKTQAKYDAYYQNKLEKADSALKNTVNEDGSVTYTEEFNKQVLGLEYDEDGAIKNPFEKPKAAAAEESVGSLDCDGQAPDQYGCCPGETYTDMGDQGFNCCPDGGGDCFPPLDLN